MNTPAILCVNANAAIDKTVVVDAFQLNAIHRPRQVLAVPGGKGVNVARGLKQLGATPVVCGWIGGFNGQFIEMGLQREGIETAFTRTNVESRTCLSILDPERNTLTEIYEAGDPLSDGEIAAFKATYRAMIAHYAAVTLSGSLPPGVPPTFYGELLEIARVAGVPGLLDSGGAALRHGLAIGKPVLIKPNAREFADLVGRKLENDWEIAESAVAVSTKYQAIVAVSLGADGVIAANRSQLIHARPPQLQIVSAVGSGDCTLAGITYGLTRDFAWSEAIRYGVAAGTANALTVGAGRFSAADFHRVRQQVTITQLSSSGHTD